MLNNFTILDKINVEYLNEQLLDNTNLLKIKDASFYKNIPQDHLILWCHNNGIYGLPTTELINWLKDFIDDEIAIEIGAGNGAIGRALNIPITDSCIMEINEVALYYLAMGQPLTKYPNDIIKLDAISTIKKYNPTIVIGCWVTQIYREEDGEKQSSSIFGIDEEFILKNVKKYIVIGNRTVHGQKRILKIPHIELQFPWLFSRSTYPNDNIIYIWERN